MIIKELDETHYRASEELSKSDLIWLLESPLHFKHRKQLVKQTDAMNFGSAFHKLLLEPHRGSDVVEMPSCMPNGEEINKRKKEHKAFLAEFEEKHKGKILVSPEEWSTLMGMLTSCGESEELSSVMCLGDNEVSAFGTYRGVDLKGRADKFIESHPRWGRTVVEVKTTIKGSASAFSREAFNRAYDVGASVYKRLFNADTVIFAIVEKQLPFCVSVFDCHHSFIEFGDKRVDMCIDRLKEIQETGKYTGYEKGIQPLLMPAWVAGQNE